MGPLQIQPEGEKVLSESGFTAMMGHNSERFFKTIDRFSPRTKLDVENFSIVAYVEAMSEDKQLDSIRAYLYQHPELRDTFPTLAGVHIRNLYLKAHPQIAQ